MKRVIKVVVPSEEGEVVFQVAIKTKRAGIYFREDLADFANHVTDQLMKIGAELPRGFAAPLCKQKVR